MGGAGSTYALRCVLAGVTSWHTSQLAAGNKTSRALSFSFFLFLLLSTNFGVIGLGRGGVSNPAPPPGELPPGHVMQLRLRDTVA